MQHTPFLVLQSSETPVKAWTVIVIVQYVIVIVKYIILKIMHFKYVHVINKKTLTILMAFIILIYSFIHETNLYKKRA